MNHKFRAMFNYIPWNKPRTSEAVEQRLGGRLGPIIKAGRIVTRSMLFSLQKSHAAFSAWIFDSGYHTCIVMQSKHGYSFNLQTKGTKHGIYYVINSQPCKICLFLSSRSNLWPLLVSQDILTNVWKSYNMEAYFDTNITRTLLTLKFILTD